MPELPHHLDRTVVIRATPSTVFRFFTENELWAKWWGAGSTIQASPGGKVYIRHPNGVEVVGEVVEVQPDDRIVFTYGYASGKPIPAGSSRVTIRLKPDEGGTYLQLHHEFAESEARDQHLQGWRFQLSLFANAVANLAFANPEQTVDAWFGSWLISDDKARSESFAKVAAPGVRFRDRFSMLDGLEELSAHAGAAQRFMPGIGLERKGAVRHCQGSLLADWVAKDREGKERSSGSSVFTMKADGKIEAVTSFTNPT